MVGERASEGALPKRNWQYCYQKYFLTSSINFPSNQFSTPKNFSIFQIFRKYQVKYNYGAMNYRVSPTYIPDKPLKFQLIERDS